MQQVHPFAVEKGDVNLPQKLQSNRKVLADDEKMAKLLRERSTAQRRRKSKREELNQLSSAIQDLESQLAKLKLFLDSLPETSRREILATVTDYGTPPLACRLCSVLEKKEEYPSVERLTHHVRTHHASDLRHRGVEFDLVKFCTEIPNEDAEMIDIDDDSDFEDSSNSNTMDQPISTVDDLAEQKRKIRLKRNAASARKSRRRKRVQLERWRMLLPLLRFQIDALEKAFQSFHSMPQSQNEPPVTGHSQSFQQIQPSKQTPQSIQHLLPENPPTKPDAVSPLQFVQYSNVDPDVVSAAYALIGCSVSSPKPAIF